MKRWTSHSRRGRAFASLAPVLWGCCCAGLLGGVLLVGARPFGMDNRAEIPAAPFARPDESVAGWLATFKPASKSAKPATEIVAAFPAASFALGSGQGLHPAAPAAGLDVVFSARMKIAAPGRYRFGAEVEGGVLSISAFGPAIASPAGQKIDGSGRTPGAAVTPTFTDWITLKPGELDLRFEFTRAGDSPARLRSMWEKQGRGDAGFVAEPIPPGVVFLPAGKEGAAGASESAFHGRILLGELGCVHCHASVTSSALVDRPAPLMAGIGARASAQWLAAWVRDPQKVKPGCGMPDVIGDAKQDQDDADAIVQFLTSLGGPLRPEPVATEAAVVATGRKIYLQVGCVACHGDLAAGSTPPAPFGNLAGKWQPSALSAFLHDPVAVRPAGRMPSLDLSPSESDLVATFLLSAWGGSPGAAVAADPARIEAGKRAFAARGCADCHHSTTPDGPEHVVSTLQARPLPTLRPGKGCLDAADTGSPRYTLSDSDRTVLGAALQEAKAWTGASCPADSAALTMNALGCINCHQWNERGGVAEAMVGHFETIGETDLGDEGRIPPRLTGVGGKLTTAWLRQVFLESGRARPYMAARMPQFGAAQVGDMAERLASSDGVWPDKDKREPAVTPEASQAGRVLTGSQGLNCISCHAFGDAALAGTPGPNIVAFAERLRYDWWRRYIMAPERFKPGTRMPSFFAKGIGDHTDILGGDPARQADALWAYFTLGEFAPAPDGLPGAGGLEVRVGDRPVVLRAFLKSAGSRGIAVGFPSGTHFAFDAEGCRLAEVWRGQFLDASGAWVGRGGMILKGQGPEVWSPPAGPALVVGARPEAWPTETGRDAGLHFKGYRIDKGGTPTFTYTLDSASGAITVEERFEPIPAAATGIRRTFSVAGAGADVWINAGKGRSAAAADPRGSADIESISGPGGATWFHIRGPKIADGAPLITVVVETTP